MELIGNLLKNVKVAGRKSKHSTSYQSRGSIICADLGSKNYSMFIRMYKNNPSRCEQAYQWVRDYPNARSKERLFLWKYKDLGIKH